MFGPHQKAKLNFQLLIPPTCLYKMQLCYSPQTPTELIKQDKTVPCHCFHVTAEHICSVPGALKSADSQLFCYRSPWTETTVKLHQLCLQQELISYLWHSGHATNEDDFTDVTLADLSILHGFLARRYRPFDQIRYDALKLRAAQLHVQVLWSRGVHSKVRQVDIGLRHRNRRGVKKQEWKIRQLQTGFRSSYWFCLYWSIYVPVHSVAQSLSGSKLWHFRQETWKLFCYTSRGYNC